MTQQTTQQSASAGLDETVRRLAALDDDDLDALDAWWRANNYLTVGQIYLMANPLLREPLVPQWPSSLGLICPGSSGSRRSGLAIR